MPSVTNLASLVLSKTQELVESAKHGDIERFNGLRLEREQLIEQLAALDVIEEPAATIETLIEARALNNQLLDEFERQQKKLLNEKSALKRGASMQRAYKQNR